MLISHKDWLRVGILMEELRALFNELSDEELENLKKFVIQEEKRCSETPLRYQNIPTGILP